jgi:hypothetical protein
LLAKQLSIMIQLFGSIDLDRTLSIFFKNNLR